MGRKKTSGPEFWPVLDSSLYIQGIRRGARRSGQRRFVSLASATRIGAERDYGVSLGWLKSRGLLDPAAPPASRWPLEVVEDVAVDMLTDGKAIATLHTRICRLKRVLRVMQPDVSLVHFNALLREFERPKARFDPIVWKVTSADLQAFGIELIKKAPVLGPAAGIPEEAVYCLGLQMALISARPWRNSTFTRMELWTNITREGGLWRMRAHAHENKQRRYQSGLIPVKLVPYFETYIQKHRPALCRLSGYVGGALWINKYGRPMTPQQFLAAFTELTADKFGERITVHCVRKIAGTTVALHDPKNVHKVPAILGHKRYQVGERHYLLAGAVQAHTDLDAAIDRLSRSAQERRRLSRRKS